MSGKSIANLTLTLVNVAMGRTPADMVIRNGVWVCVQSGEFIPETDVAINQVASRSLAKMPVTR